MPVPSRLRRPTRILQANLDPAASAICFHNDRCSVTVHNFLPVNLTAMFVLAGLITVSEHV